MLFTDDELEMTKKKNYQYVRELIRISFGLGVNLTPATLFKERLKIINILLLIFSGLSMYGHWCYVMASGGNIPKITESISCALQSIISMIKLMYFLVYQHKFQRLVQQANGYQILRESEIFSKEFLIHTQLKTEILQIMDNVWRNIRRQLVFYICACALITSNYFFRALIFNTYHQIMETPDYEIIMPFPVYFEIWKDKGFAFPYYHIEMFLCGCSVYIAGMGAVSFDGIFIVLCLHCYGLLESVKVMVQYSTSPLIPKDRRVEYLRYCIYFHQRVVNYVNATHAIFKHISIAQFLISLVVLGLVLFQMSYGLEEDFNVLIRMIMYISAAGYEIILFCYNGQRLTDASDGIPMAFYNCEWYNESEEFKQLLRMMIMRTNRIVRFDISWFSTMSLPTLAAFAKTSGSYFLLLRNLSE